MDNCKSVGTKFIAAQGRRSSRIAGIGALAAAVFVSPLLAATPASATKTVSQVEVVKFGIGPYFEGVPMMIAHQLGLDREQGLDFKFTPFVSAPTIIEALSRGTIEVAQTCIVCDYPFYAKVAQLRDWMITDNFRGFIVIGRKGHTETYASLAAKIGPAAAKAQILKSFKGKTFDILTETYKPLLVSALAQVGLTLKDIHIVPFADDATAALAFEHGTGDYYMGSLPEEAKLLELPGYVNVGGSQILGPAGLWYSTEAALSSWLTSHRAVAMKILAVWYRTTRYMQAEPQRTLPLFTKDINSLTASHYTQRQVGTITTQLETYETWQQAKAGPFNPSSSIYFGKSVDYYARADASSLPKVFRWQSYDVEEQYFNAFLGQKGLLAWVNSPLS